MFEGDKKCKKSRGSSSYREANTEAAARFGITSFYFLNKFMKFNSLSSMLYFKVSKCLKFSLAQIVDK